MKRLALNLLAAGLSIVVAVVAIELVMQAVDYPPDSFSPWIRAHDTGYRYAPSLETRMRRPGEFDVAFTTNSSGFRDDEVGRKSRLRVLMLGDSFASGYGVERDEMIATLLEEQLDVDVVNAGVGGYEIVHQVHFYQARGKTLDPDLVLYLLYLGNDISRNDEWKETADGGLVSIEREYPVRAPREIKLRSLYQQLRYNRRVRKEQAAGEWVPLPDYLPMCEKQPSAETERRYGRVETLLARLRDEVRSSGARLFVATFSYRTAVDRAAERAFAEKTPGFDDRYDLRIPERRVGTLLDRLDIDWANLNPTLRAHFETGGGPLYFPVDGHFNVAGNRLVADTLAPLLRQRLADIRESSQPHGH